MAKGFGSKPEEPRAKSEGQIKRDQEASKYDEISAGGGQEYSIFVRQFGSDDQSWFPCGSIAVPRGAQVSDAVFANESALKVAIVRTYPKLKGEEDEFEFGYNLKVSNNVEYERLSWRCCVIVRESSDGSSQFGPARNQSHHVDMTILSLEINNRCTRTTQ